MRRSITALALCLLLSGCAAQGKCEVTELNGTLFLQLDAFTGTRCVELLLCQGDEVDFFIDRQSGRIDLSFALDTPIYTGNDAQSGTFTVIVPSDGTYVFTLTGTRADGSLTLFREDGAS